MVVLDKNDAAVKANSVYIVGIKALNDSKFSIVEKKL
jgi:hypothetical protein